jgi:hypothetical protein
MAEEAKAAADTPPPPPDKEDGEVAEANAAPQSTEEGPHPLEHKWTFWEHKAAEKKTMSKKEWGELQRKLFTFDTVEEFWRYYAHIPTPSAVFYDGKAGKKRVGKPPDDRQIESFSLFKDGISPEWEDSANMSGGEWNLRKSSRDGRDSPMIDDWWQNIVLGLVGHTIEDKDEICGARIVDKSGNKGSNQVFRIELWLRTKDSKVIKKILDKMIEVMLDGKQPKGRGLGADDFQWKMHGV